MQASLLCLDRSKQAHFMWGTTSNHKRPPLLLHTFLGKEPDRLQIFRIRHPQDHFLCSSLFVFSQPLANHLGCADKSLVTWKGDTLRKGRFLGLRNSAVE